MKNLTLHCDLETAGKMLAHCGSLAAPYYGDGWRDLYAALGEPGEGWEETILYRAEWLAREAVPDEAFPHPQRAAVSMGYGTSRPSVKFITPGGVTVRISRPDAALHGSPLWVSIDFGRNSLQLAGQMLAQIAIFGGEPAYMIDADGEATTAGEALRDLLGKMLAR